jgi:hypothetical protein
MYVHRRKILFGKFSSKYVLLNKKGFWGSTILGALGCFFKNNIRSH